MKKTISNYISLAIILFLLQGCSAAMVPYTNDPLEIMNWSMELTSRGRSIGARNMMLGTWNKIDKNDTELVATYYRTKAYLISSSYYQRSREHDIKSEKITWNTEVDGNLDDAEKCYLKARSLFIDVNSFYNASHTSYLLSKFYKQTKNEIAQCQALKETKRLHLLGKSGDPKDGTEVATTGNTNSFEEHINNELAAIFCIK